MRLGDKKTFDDKNAISIAQPLCEAIMSMTARTRLSSGRDESAGL
ncbi:hypothetical protein [Pseudoalteromonas sp. 120-MNA-CIBAN-0494]